MLGNCGWIQLLRIISGGDCLRFPFLSLSLFSDEVLIAHHLSDKQHFAMEDILPNSFSWKTLLDSIIPVRDQDHLPCSWAFAAAALVSYQLKICNNEVWDFEASAQHLIEYCQGDSEEVLPKPRKGILAVLQYIQNHGVPLQTRHPYRVAQYFRKAVPSGPRIWIRGIECLRRDTSLTDIKKILHRHPIIACMEEVYCSFLLEEFSHKEEDVYDKNTGAKVGESHYLLITGYGNQNGRDFYEVHNPWGREWGNCGYGRILCELVTPLAYVKEAKIDMACVGNKVWELQDIELENEKPETEGRDMSCCGPAAGQKVSEPETKKLKLMTAKEVEYDELGDDDVSPPTVLYCQESPNDVPDQLFKELAQLSVAKYNKEAPFISHCKFVDLIKVTSVMCNGVIFTLTITANLSGTKAPVPGFGFAETLVSEIWYQGGSPETGVREVFVQRALEYSDSS